MNQLRFRAIILFLPLYVAFPVLTPAAHAATTLTVTTTADNSTFTMGDGSCPLREAIFVANGGPSTADCGVNKGAPYTVNFAVSGTITLVSTLTIGSDMTIDGAGKSVTVNGNNAVGVFYVNTDVTFNLLNLVVTNGLSESGGGLYNKGTLNVTNCTISANSAESGGGIENFETLNLNNSTISGNTASLHGGGGIDNTYGTVTVSNSTISGNTSVYGGGIHNYQATLTVINSTISGNSGTYGGGIGNWGIMTVTNSTLSGNSALTNGGGIDNSWGTATVTNSTLSGNSASNGGGIYTYNGTSTITNCTLAANSSIGIYNYDGTVNVTNSIIVKGGTSNYCCYGGHSSAFSNLADDNTCGSDFTESSSILLGALGNYGGGAQTLPLLPGSAAIEAGDSSTCSNAAVNNLDQRGLPRPAGHCDIGAFESQGFTLTKNGGDNQSAVINTDFVSALQVTLKETGGAHLSGALINFSAPSSGASTNPATFAATTGAGGVASATITANSTLGAYSVTASAAGAAGVDFILENVAGLATLTIGFAGDGSGTITSTNPDDPDISCIKSSSGGCNASYPLKTSVTLAASGDWKSLFGNWSGGIAGSDNPVTFNLNSDKTVTATFNPDYKVRRLSGGALFTSIQDAYTSVPTGSITIQAQVKSFLEELLFNSNSNVTLSGGMDAGYNPTTGYSTVNKLTVGAGQAVISNFIVK